MKIFIVSQFGILIAFFFLNFEGAEFTKIFSKRALNNTGNYETGFTGNFTNEKNADVIGDDSLKSIVLEYEKELKKELERRKSETGKDINKVKREDSEAKIEEFENRDLQYKSYRIERKKRSSDKTQLDNPEEWITQFENSGKKIIQKVKESSEAVALDVAQKIETLQNNAKKALSPENVNKEFDLLFATLSGNNKAPFANTSLHTVGDESSSSKGLEGHGTASIKDGDSEKDEDSEEGDTKEDDAKKDNTKVDNTKVDNTKEDNTKEDNTKEDNTKEDNTKEDNTKEDNTKEDNTKVDNSKVDTTKEDNTKDNTKEDNTKEDDAKVDTVKGKDVTEGKGGLSRKKRNARKDEPENKPKGKSTRKRKDKKKEKKKDKENGGDNEMKENMDCKLIDEKCDEGKNETKKDDKQKDSKPPGVSVKEEKMNDMDDVKEGTDYDESEV